MGNLSSVTLDNSTFAVFAGGGGSDVPIHVNLPKSASDSTPSGLAMLAWPNGMRYVYCNASPSNTKNVTGFIPPEYMGNGSVYIADKSQTILDSEWTGGSSGHTSKITLGQYGNSVIGDSTSGANVIFEVGFSRTSTIINSQTSKPNAPPAKTSILFFVNPN